MTSRRAFLKTLAEGVVCTVLPPRVFLPFITADKTPVPARGWNVTCDTHVMSDLGQWVGEQALDLLKPDHWHNWGTSKRPDRLRQIPMAFNGQWWNRTETARWMAAHPDMLWLFGNELERPEQGNETPVNAAILTGELIELGHSIGVRVLYAAAGTFIGANQYDGLTWLTRYINELDARSIRRPDKWSVHSYNSWDVATFRASWARWQEWHAHHGDGKPVIMSEGCAHESAVSTQTAVMDEFAGLLAGGDLEAVYWYTACCQETDPWRNSALCALDTATQTARLTSLGDHWKDVQRQLWQS